MTAPGRVLDAHIHLWDPAELTYPWLQSQPHLRRPFLPFDLRATGGAQEWIMVEAGARSERPFAEIQWATQLATLEPALRGMVVHAPVEDGREVRKVLDKLTAFPLAVGVRRLIQDEPAGFASSAAFIDGVRVVGEFGLPFDLCVRAAQRPDLSVLVDACSEVTFILDHLGKPEIEHGEWEPWHKQITDLAQRPNVACKLSGSTTEAGAHWSERTVRPYLLHALESFGTGRCMFGSDWPVSSATTTYARWTDAVADTMSSCTQDEIDAVFAGNAERIYSLPVRTGP